jgi:hypothetical protein
LKKLFILNFLILVGCTTTVNTNIQPIYTDKLVFNFVDTRAEKSKVTNNGSYIFTKCDYGINSWGDERIEPTKPEILKSILSSKASEHLNNKTFTLIKFDTILNLKSMLLQSNDNFHGGTGLINYLGGGCGKQKDYYGGYTAEENPSKSSVWIGEIVAKVGDEKYSVRHVLPIAKRDNWNERFPDIILQTVDKLISKINSANK